MKELKNNKLIDNAHCLHYVFSGMQVANDLEMNDKERSNYYRNELNSSRLVLEKLKVIASMQKDAIVNYLKNGEPAIFPFDGKI